MTFYSYRIIHFTLITFGWNEGLFSFESLKRLKRCSICMRTKKRIEQSIFVFYLHLYSKSNPNIIRLFLCFLLFSCDWFSLLSSGGLKVTIYFFSFPLSPSMPEACSGGKILRLKNKKWNIKSKFNYRDRQTPTHPNPHHHHIIFIKLCKKFK